MTETVTETPVAEILLRAADVIESSGWTRAQRVSALTGGYCVVGAIEYAVYGDVAYGVFQESRLVYEHPAVVAFEEYLHDLLGYEGPAWAWNDDQGDPQIVIDTLRRAARNLGGPQG